VKVIYTATALGADDGPLRRSGLLRYVIDRPAEGVDVTGYPVRADVVAVVTAEFGADADGPFPSSSFDGQGYAVEERVQWDYERTWPDGAATPGIKQISFLKRLAGTSRAEFAEHWTQVHTRLARKHHPTIWRYVQNVVIEKSSPDAPDLDGIAELSFRTIGDWRDRKYDSEAGRQIIAADVKTFIEVSSLWHRITKETIVRSQASI
jgi:uncharacterized protein (TIGR02118 family)